LQKPGDEHNHQSDQYTLVIFDELTSFQEEMYTYLFSRLRSPKRGGVWPQIVSGTNPGNVGHMWVYRRFIQDMDPGKVYAVRDPEFPQFVFYRCFIPALAQDNVDGMANDPAYLARMKMNMPDELYAALARGDWSVSEGLAFNEWNSTRHVCSEFKVPPRWKVIRALDWGYSAPFSVGWWAQNPDSGTIYRIAEWYGGRARSTGTMQGLEMSADEVATGIRDRESVWVREGRMPEPWYGVGDPAVFKQDQQGKCVADDLNAGGTLFRAGNNSRAVGKQTLHGLLRLSPTTGEAGLRVFASCQHFIRSFPLLARDTKNPEDVDTTQEDHIYDETRYACVDLVSTKARKFSDADLREMLRQTVFPGALV